jgi:hypothetical protein
MQSWVERQAPSPSKVSSVVIIVRPEGFFPAARLQHVFMFNLGLGSIKRNLAPTSQSVLFFLSDRQLDSTRVEGTSVH